MVITTFMVGIMVLGTGNICQAETKEAFAVYIKADGIYLSFVDSQSTKKLDKGTKIKYPKISPDGTAVAYIKNNNLYVCKISDGKISKVANGESAFDWIDDTKLVYGNSTGGIIVRDIKTSKNMELGSKKYHYYHIESDGKNQIYANKFKMVIKEDGTYQYPQGIIRINTNTGKGKRLISPKPADERGLSYSPQIAGISEDGSCLYIWERTSSGSTSADGIRLGVYDIKKNVFYHSSFEDVVDSYETPYQYLPALLQNKSNFSYNPNNPKELAVNSGTGREMYQNKAVGILNINNESYKNLTTKDQVTMTVDFSKDGKSVYYSGSKALEYRIGDEEQSIWDIWENQEHGIYKKILSTGETVQLTKGAFDFLPKEIEENKVLFIRKNKENYQLQLIKNGKIIKIADFIDFESEYINARYYGCYYADRVIDYYFL